MRQPRLYEIALLDMDGKYQPWRAYVGAFRLYSVETPDRRRARRITRLAQRLGYGVRFRVLITREQRRISRSVRMA